MPPTPLAAALQVVANPEPLWLLTEVGLVLLDRKQLDDAVKVFEAVCALSPQEPLGYIGLGEAALAQDQARQAHKFALEASRVPRHSPYTAARTYFLLGRALEALGRYKEAEGAFSKSVSIDCKGVYAKSAHDSLVRVQQVLGQSDTPSAELQGG